jgi:hypothetical protein
MCQVTIPFSRDQDLTQWYKGFINTPLRPGLKTRRTQDRVNVIPGHNTGSTACHDGRTRVYLAGKEKSFYVGVYVKDFTLLVVSQHVTPLVLEGVGPASNKIGRAG